jgi:hypothetical protein
MRRSHRHHAQTRHGDKNRQQGKRFRGCTDAHNDKTTQPTPEIKRAKREFSIADPRRNRDDCAPLTVRLPYSLGGTLWPSRFKKSNDAD